MSQSNLFSLKWKLKRHAPRELAVGPKVTALPRRSYVMLGSHLTLIIIANIYISALFKVLYSITLLNPYS